MKSRNACFPLIIGAVGVMTGLVLGYHRIGVAPDSLRLAVTTILGMYLLWILSEYHITAGEARKDAGDDQGTCEVYALARMLTVFTALGFDAVWTEPGAWLPLGLSLFIGGIALRAWAIRALGRSYSHRVRTPEAENIISDGPYRRLRHPAYSGMLLAHVGFVLLFFSWPLVLMFSLVFVPALVRRILLEERYLFRIMPAYEEFANGRARLVPGVW